MFGACVSEEAGKLVGVSCSVGALEYGLDAQCSVFTPVDFKAGGVGQIIFLKICKLVRLLCGVSTKQTYVGIVLVCNHYKAAV